MTGLDFRSNVARPRVTAVAPSILLLSSLSALPDTLGDGVRDWASLSRPSSSNVTRHVDTWTTWFIISFFSSAARHVEMSWRGVANSSLVVSNMDRPRWMLAGVEVEEGVNNVRI